MYLIKVAEVVWARILPGAINTLSVYLLGQWLNEGKYAEYSTMLAGSTMVGTIVSGPMKLVILPLHAKMSNKHGVAKTESSVLGATILLSLVCAGFGAIGVLGGVVPVAAVAILISSMALTIWQQVLLARLLYWQYGIAELLNAVFQLLLIFVIIRKSPSVDASAFIYSTSNAIGLFCGWLLVGSPMPKWPAPELYLEAYRLGKSLTIANIAESALGQGIRSTIALIATKDFQDRYCFAVDFAQRTIGTAISITSFGIMPRAYLQKSRNQERELKRTLLLGTGMSVLVAMGVMLLIVELNTNSSLGEYRMELFSKELFVMVSVAAIMNRSKKLYFDTRLVLNDSQSGIAEAYLWVVVPALAFAFIVISIGKEQLVPVVHLTAYSVVLVLTGVSVRSR